ncbi:hypothetical protein SCLARK_00902 [Spiroplasma clarkii]|nr:hypothetical protein [Spiroplasma clarkii]ARU91511.1 hypothetical protein SCLARK_00902 [Spiroplasma clarkii]
MEMEQAALDSLVNSAAISSFKNPLLEENIAKQRKVVDILNKYYYEVILPDESVTDSFDINEKEFEKELKIYKRIQRR